MVYPFIALILSAVAAAPWIVSAPIVAQQSQSCECPAQAPVVEDWVPVTSVPNPLGAGNLPVVTGPRIDGNCSSDTCENPAEPCTWKLKATLTFTAGGTYRVWYQGEYHDPQGDVITVAANNGDPYRYDIPCSATGEAVISVEELSGNGEYQTIGSFTVKIKCKNCPTILDPPQ